MGNGKRCSSWRNQRRGRKRRLRIPCFPRLEFVIVLRTNTMFWLPNVPCDYSIILFFPARHHFLLLHALSYQRWAIRVSLSLHLFLSRLLHPPRNCWQATRLAVDSSSTCDFTLSLLCSHFLFGCWQRELSRWQPLLEFPTRRYSTQNTGLEL